MGAERIELPHHAAQRLFYLANRVLGVELTLLVEAALALEELLPVEVREGGHYRVARRARIGQEARNPVP
jgi:hypothetical protein